MPQSRHAKSFLLTAILIAQCACGGQLSGPAEAPPGSKSQPKFKPGFNLFSAEQDVQMGQQSAQQIMRETPMLRDDDPLTQYVRRLGAKLSAKAAGERFNYQFWVVPTKEINAFALPGGFLFVNAGAIAAARNEGEIAGVMAHEIAHAALRHGTNQASKARLAQGGLGILGAIAGSGESPALGQVVNGIGGFGANMLFMKFGRTAEKQADLEGARIIAETGYDPRDMANFFKTLQAESGGRTPEILSDHPDPGNRIKYILDEIPKLPVGPNATHSSPEFEQAKARLTGQAPPQLAARSQLHRVGPKDPTDLALGTRPPRPTGQFKGHQASDGSFAVQFPANWDVLSSGDSTVIMSPKGAYGKLNDSLMVTHGIFVGAVRANAGDLRAATEAFVQRQIETNQDFQVVRAPQPVTIGGRQGLVTVVAGPSAHTGVMEVDATYTFATADGRMFYLITIAPEDEANTYKPAFEQILRSLQLAR